MLKCTVRSLNRSFHEWEVERRMSMNNMVKKYMVVIVIVGMFMGSILDINHYNGPIEIEAATKKEKK